ncbi:MAG: hypothetical protein JXR86_15805, partial [Spirochaetales bacterium]|nr:hypothetical protein [Spirochaetales bacterium]
LDFPEAQKEIKRVLEKVTEQDHLSGEIYGILLLARTEWAQNHLDKGNEYLERSQKQLKNLKYHEDYKFLLANKFEIEALIQGYRNNYRKSLVLWYKLLELAPDLDNRESYILPSFLGIGQLYHISEILVQASQCFQYAWEYSQQIGDIQLIVKCGFYLSSIYSQKGEVDALSHQLDAMEPHMTDESIDQAWKIDYLTYKNQVLFAEGPLGDALEMSFQLIRQSREYSYMWSLWKSSELNTEILIADDQPRKAVESLCRSIDDMNRGMMNIPSKAFLLASQLWERIENYEKSLIYQKEYRERKILELSRMRENKILNHGIKSRYYNLLMEYHFLKWQLHSGATLIMHKPEHFISKLFSLRFCTHSRLS